MNSKYTFIFMLLFIFNNVRNKCVMLHMFKLTILCYTYSIYAVCYKKTTEFSKDRQVKVRH